MKEILLLLILSSLFTMSGYSQKDAASRLRNQQKADSAIAARTIQKMQELFTVSADQQQALKKATVTLRHYRQTVFAESKKTSVLQEKMQQQEHMQDSVYQSIIGGKNYALYKEAIQKEREQKKAAMIARVQAKFGTIDTTNLKPKANEKQ